MRRWLILFASFACLAGLSAADWPQWRGPDRNGLSSEHIRTNWPADGPKLVWRAAVGTGFSSVAISQGRAYTLGNTDNEDILWCLDALTGKLLWKHIYPSRLDPQWYEGGPGATPTVLSNCVFTISKWGDVFCLDAVKGTVLWSHDLRQDHFKPNRWGFAGSPLLWRNLVIVNAGDAGVALDRLNGHIVWQSGTNAAGYASPTLFPAPRPSVLIFAAKYLVALDPASGRELWRHPWPTDWDTNIPDPLVQGERVFVSSFSRGCALLSIKDGRPEVIYDTKALCNHLSPALLLGDYLYGFNGEAKTDTDLRCLHLPTGRVVWTRKDPAFGSLIGVDGRLLILSGKGELLLLQPPSLDPRPSTASTPSTNSEPFLARAKVLSGTCWTPPALANGLLYVRNAKGDLRGLDLRP